MASHDFSSRKAMQEMEGPSQQKEEESDEAIIAASANKSERKTLLMSLCGIGPRTVNSAGSALIHPNSPFYVTSSSLIAMFLLYTAIVTPVMVSYYWHQEACDKMPTLEFDVFIDCIFLVDIGLTFFVGVYHEGKYIDDQAFVVMQYLRSGFFFDLGTSFPVSFMEAAILAQCSAGKEGIDGIQPSSLRMIRVAKPLRLFKLVRIVKVVKTLAIADAIGDRFRIPPRILRLIKVLSGIALGVHTCSCTFWLVKVVTSSMEEVDTFREEYGISADVQVQYLASFYFITTIMTTIGFGDIVPRNSMERLYCIIVMYMGSVIFGILLAEVQQVVAQASQDAREKDTFIQTLLDFMREHEIPRETENEVIRWAQFDFEQKHTTRKQKEILSLLPPPLRRTVLRFLHKDSLESIPLILQLSRAAGKELTLDLYASMLSVTYYPASIICQSNQTADRLFVVASGIARVDITMTRGRLSKQMKMQRANSRRSTSPNESPMPVEDQWADDASDSDHEGDIADKDLVMLTVGDYFGEYCLLGETDWGASFPGFDVKITAVTALMCMVLTREKFIEILMTYPLAIQNRIQMMTEEYMEKAKQQKRMMKAKQTRISFRWTKLFNKLRVQSEQNNGEDETSLVDHLGLSIASAIVRSSTNKGKKDKTNGNYGIESVQEGCCETDTIGLETAANSGLSSGPVQMINSMDSVGSSAKDLDNRSRVGFLKFDIEETPFGPKNNGNDTHQMADLCARVDALGTQMQRIESALVQVLKRPSDQDPDLVGRDALRTARSADLVLRTPVRLPCEASPIPSHHSVIDPKLRTEMVRPTINGIGSGSVGLDGTDTPEIVLVGGA